MRPPPDIRKANPGIIWKLNKPLYGLDDACHRFYLKILKTFNEADFQVLPSDDAYFYLRKEGKLIGQISAHVDDFYIAAKENFLNWIRDYQERS